MSPLIEIRPANTEETKLVVARSNRGRGRPSRYTGLSDQVAEEILTHGTVTLVFQGEQAFPEAFETSLSLRARLAKNGMPVNIALQELFGELDPVTGTYPRLGIAKLIVKQQDSGQ